MHRKFNDIFARCLVIMKSVVISYIKEYRGPTLRPPCDVIDDDIIMKILFLYNLGPSFHIWGPIEAVFNISKFLKWTPFLARDKLFTGSYTGRRIYQKNSHEHFRRFELLIDVVIQILTEIYQFQIWPILWPGDVINDVMNMYSYNCSHNLMIHMHRKFNDDIFARCLVIMKNVIFHLYRIIEGRLWGHPVTSSMTSSSWKYFFLHNLGRSFHIWGQIEAVFNISKFSKWPLFWARDKLFYRKLYRKLNRPEI